jgi:hypothetical protein
MQRCTSNSGSSAGLIMKQHPIGLAALVSDSGSPIVLITKQLLPVGHAVLLNQSDAGGPIVAHC